MVGPMVEWDGPEHRLWKQRKLGRLTPLDFWAVTLKLLLVPELPVRVYVNYSVNTKIQTKK